MHSGIRDIPGNRICETGHALATIEKNPARRTQPHLDGSYTVFGRVVSGFNVLGAITQGDRIRSIHR